MSYTPPTPPSPGMPYQPQWQTQRTGADGVSIAALVTGILGICVPLLPLVAIILGAIGLRRTRQPGAGGQGLAIAGLVLGICGVLFFALQISILLPSLNRAREMANRAKCRSQLAQIGTGLRIYAVQNNGQFPPDLATLLTEADLPSGITNCPDAPTSGTSYVYVGKGVSERLVTSNDAIVFEVLSNHHGEGGNVVFGDGHVDWVPRKSYNALVNNAVRARRLNSSDVNSVMAGTKP
ncbi:MAG: DUF4190 domain-containing protein [Tepidisphaeraceae bacterium]